MNCDTENDHVFLTDHQNGYYRDSNRAVGWSMAKTLVIVYVS